MCVGTRKEGVTSCNVKEQETGGANGRKNVNVNRPINYNKKKAFNKIRDMWPKYWSIHKEI
jgi:hypothetical protein